MRAVLTAMVAAIEAVAVALVGMAVVMVPALLLWVVTFDLAAEPSDLFGSAVGIWFLAHLTPLEFGIGADDAVALGLPQAAIAFPISLAPLGLTLLTAALAARSGWRFGSRGGTGAAAAFGGAVGFAAAAAVTSPIAADLLVPPIWVAVLTAGLVYGVASLGGFLVRAVRDDHDWWRLAMRAVQRGIGQLGLPGDAAFPRRLAEAFRLALAALLGLLGLAGAALAVSLVAGYVQVATLSQALQLDALGAFAVFVLQLALLPVFVIWGASWLSGAGFSVGIGSSVTPFETLLGPVPALPLFGAIPQGWGSAGALAPALLVLIGLAVGAMFARRPVLRRASWTAALSVALAAAVIVGLACAGLGALAHGGIGPDRLAETGPHPWLFGGLVAAEIGGGLLLGVAAGRLDGARLRAVLPGATAARDAEDDAEGAFGLAGAGFGEPLDEQATVPLDSSVRPIRAKRWRRRKAGADGAGDGSDSTGDAASGADAQRGGSWGAVPADLDAADDSGSDAPGADASEADDSGADPAETDGFASAAEARAPREPELFDIEQHDTGDTGDRASGVSDSDAADGGATGAGAGADAGTGAAELDDEIDEEALLRAFAWDDSAVTLPSDGEAGGSAAGLSENSGADTRAPGDAGRAGHTGRDADRDARDDAEARPGKRRRTGWRFPFTGR